MKETFTRRFFVPLWKCEEIESELEKLESDGWRLEKISGFRKFHFVKSNPKAVKYFFTYCFAKESGMYVTEEVLKRRSKATEIKGHFFGLLNSTAVFRMTKETDLSDRRIYRNIYLRYILLQYILISALFTLLSVATIILSCVQNENPLIDIRHLIFAIIGLFGMIGIIYHLIGLLYLRREYSKKFQKTNNEEQK